MTKFDSRTCRRLADAIAVRADEAPDYETMLVFDGFARAWRRHADLQESRPDETASVDGYIGARVLQRRHEMGLSAEDLAKRCGIELSQIECCEAGVGAVQAALVWRLSRALSRPVEFFYPLQPPRRARRLRPASA